MMVYTAKAVAKAAGYDAKIQQTVFSALIPSLTSDKIDMISAAMIKTSARAKVVDFSDPVYDHYGDGLLVRTDETNHRSEEHTSELQSLMRISYAVFCLKKKTGTIR